MSPMRMELDNLVLTSAVICLGYLHLINNSRYQMKDNIMTYSLARTVFMYPMIWML